MKSKISLKAFKLASMYGLVALGAAGVTGLTTSPARAAAPLPFDLPTPPPNVNIGILYNQFSSAGGFYTANGAKVGNTSIATYVPILRYTHTFGQIDGMQWGVQLIVPDVNFLGTPKVGGAGLSNNSGLAEPALSAFIYPYDNPSEDSYLVLAYFLSPPVGAYQSTKALNAGTNNVVNNIEAGYGHILFGTPRGRRLSFEFWADAYFYSVNGDGPMVAGAHAHVHTEPSGQFILYLPYYFHPKTDAYVSLSLEQTIGGKQYLTSAPGRVDTGNRNDVTTIGVEAGEFVAPTVFAQASLATDVRVRGGARRDVIFQIQVGKIF